MKTLSIALSLALIFNTSVAAQAADLINLKRSALLNQMNLEAESLKNSSNKLGTIEAVVKDKSLHIVVSKPNEAYRLVLATALSALTLYGIQIVLNRDAFKSIAETMKSGNEDYLTPRSNGRFVFVTGSFVVVGAGTFLYKLAIDHFAPDSFRTGVEAMTDVQIKTQLISERDTIYSKGLKIQSLKAQLESSAN